MPTRTVLMLALAIWRGMKKHLEDPERCDRVKYFYLNNRPPPLMNHSLLPSRRIVGGRERIVVCRHTVVKRSPQNIDEARLFSLSARRSRGRKAKTGSDRDSNH